MGKRIRKATRHSPSPNPHDKSDNKTPISIAAATPLATLSLNSVLLHDWWLGTPRDAAHSKGLSIAGFEFRGRQGQRLFCSSAIAKRHGATTLETADGIKIAISGFINISRTLQSGFSLEFCSHFHLGFPYDWEEYASQYSDNEACATRCTEASVTGLLGPFGSSPSNPISPLPVSLDSLSAPGIRDLLMFSTKDSQNSLPKGAIFDHVLQKLGNHDSQNVIISADSNIRKKHSTTSSFSANDQNSNDCKKVKLKQNHMDEDYIPASRSARTMEHLNDGQSKRGVSILTPIPGVRTRSMTKLKNLTEKQEVLSLKSSVESEIAVQVSSPKAKRGNHYGETQENRLAKNVSANSPKKSSHLSTSEPSQKHPRKIATRSALRGNCSTTLAR
ncbi:SANT associated [Corchorus capsularis]|uniref:SANT associated n=1 Tax=Corchorus capsularis TaxID=210143 RepID=A0A1R3GIG9_COCAP|nr:SANT associated [Corchorus capsularis]